MVRGLASTPVVIIAEETYLGLAQGSMTGEEGKKFSLKHVPVTILGRARMKGAVDD